MLNVNPQYSFSNWNSQLQSRALSIPYEKQPLRSAGGVDADDAQIPDNQTGELADDEEEEESDDDREIGDQTGVKSALSLTPTSLRLEEVWRH